jgi:hypothetical protein
MNGIANCLYPIAYLMTEAMRFFQMAPGNGQSEMASECSPDAALKLFGPNPPQTVQYLVCPRLQAEAVSGDVIGARSCDAA